MIPQPFTLILPVIASALAGWLKDLTLPRWANYAITIACFVAAVVASIALGGGLTGDPGKDLGLIIAACTAVFAALKPLTDEMSIAVSSPLTRWTKRGRARREAMAAWKATLAKVPPRAHAPNNAPTMPGIAPDVVEGTGQAMPSQPGIE